MSIELHGNWKKGFAFDVHTLSSTYLGVDEYGHDRWESTRSEMGELVYQLKYRNNTSVLPKIIDLLSRFNGIDSLHAIIPIPSTNKARIYQPVVLIARELGARNNVQVLENLLTKAAGGSELKNVDNPQGRRQLLTQSMSINNEFYLNGKSVLLLDDLYRSGETLSVATELLYNHCNVANVFVLTMTKTRSNR